MTENKTYTTIQDLLEDPSFNEWVRNPRSVNGAKWTSWLNEHPTNQVLVDEAKDIIIGINFKKEKVLKEKVDSEWEKLEKKLQSIQNQKLENQVKTKTRLTNVKYISVAASLLLLVSISVFTFSLFSKVTHKTNYGEMLNVVLDDGSTVILNSNSSITYSNYNPRHIELKGEAFFNVKKELATKAKFSVSTNDLTVEVFGTQFNVKTSKNKTNVYLQEGSILLNLNNGNKENMSPGNYIEYSSEKQKVLVNKSNFITEEYVSWKSGNLIFNNTTLAEALAKVSDNYGVTFKYNNPETKSSLITGKVPTTDLTICLNAIKKSANVKIQKENGILVVYKN